MSELLEFSWPVHRAGYELREGVPNQGKRASEILLSKDLSPGLHIVARGKDYDWREPLKGGLSVFRNFIDAEPTPEGALKFTEAYGLLTELDAYNITPSCLVSGWLYRQKTMRDALKSWEAGDISGLIMSFATNKLGELTTKLRSNKSGTSIDLVLQPRSLWSFMHLEFALLISNKAELKQCENCGTWFPYGTGTGRRSKARFCSDPCRKASHAKAKREAGK